MQKNVRTKAFLLKAMRMTVTQFLLLVAFCGLASARDTKAQEVLNTSVSLKIESVEIKRVFNTIEKQANIKFVYSPNAIRSDQKVSLVMTNKLSEVLRELLTPLNISYEVVGTRILLRKKLPEKSASIDEISVPVPNATEPQEQIIKGKVTDAEKNEGLPGVSILLKGTQKGTSTNVNGEFSLAVPDNNAVLVFSFVGYEPQEMVVGSRTQINISLKTDTKALGEVVVVGYGTQRAKDVTGSVATINQTTIKDLPVSSVDQKMIGQVAGVQIQQLSGAPGGGTSVRIRGSGSLGAGNEPLYVVDGMPYAAGLNQNFNPLLLINPNDIESISILKDASSTAIYGSRGANGVIMITTKKGQYNRLQVNVSSMRGSTASSPKRPT